MSIYDKQKKIATDIENCVNKFVSWEIESFFVEEQIQLKHKDQKEISKLFNTLFQSLAIENNEDIHEKLLESFDIFTDYITKSIIENIGGRPMTDEEKKILQIRIDNL